MTNSEKILEALRPGHGLPENAATRSYARLLDMPADVLATRVVSSLIECKGRLNEYAVVLEALIKAMREELVLPVPGLEGWKLVPVEITQQMQHAYFDVIDKNLPRVESDAMFGRYASGKEAYRAMIAAAPKPLTSLIRDDSGAEVALRCPYCSSGAVLGESIPHVPECPLCVPTTTTKGTSS